MTEYFHWHGRDDGPGDEHARWFTTIIDAEAEPVPPNTITLVGFASDTGVARNHGRVGAATGPTALREALTSLAIHDDRVRADAHTITYTNTSDLEAGQQQLSDTVAALLDNGSGTVVTLGGGHETSWASHRGLRQSHHGDGKSIAIINLDAHFDLRTSNIATSGTPFKQIADAWPHDFHYTVLGISEPNNTRVLFQTADQLGVTYVTDDALADLTAAEAAELVTKAAATTDILHLSIDLDVLPAHVAPGVSAPATLGVALPQVRAMCLAAAHTGKLRLVDVVELNPTYDVDGRTAKVAARLIHDITTALPHP